MALDYVCEYDAPGEYMIAIFGKFPHYEAHSQHDNGKLLSVESWGNISWRSFAFSFSNTVNLKFNTHEAPDLARVKSLSGMFSSAAGFNEPLNHWDTSQVTDMSLMFYLARAFNQAIGSWNTSQVTDMSFMFFSAGVFNQDISNWDTSQVTDVSFMFYRANSFDRDISDWNIEQVIAMVC